ncbi:regulatory protein, luxR family [Reichenbachiella faecimaris]|uniref:Regulatory protein, luxR family n=1 Tax=Reichenbachiella faecimaris TaxID=692418 RepID=A0A1W2GQA1_REIFA|nr:LuxR C-terminal-related transcriptional regulator [Reichenbachiella faecimaris]SMD38781.1 regulatory protein, luxR family [Reichenbachiella faecimaris]
MKKSAIFIGLSVGLLLTLLNALDYFHLIRVMSFELYAAGVGLLFMVLGIWAGVRLSGSRKQQPLPKVSLENGKKINLSDRELDVLIELNNGLSNQEIADKLFVSLNTVKTHISNLYLKLHAKRRTQALAKAKELRIVE